MRNTFLVLSLGMSCLLAWGHTAQGQTGSQSRRGTIDRDRRVERAISERYHRVMKLLRPEVKSKLAGASRALLKEIVSGPGHADLEVSLRAEVDGRFTGLSAAQLELVSFCALADVAQYATRLLDGRGKKANLASHAEGTKKGRDSLSEMGEMESLRLQMALDRQSKMMSTLSNLLKKISDTSNRITQNIK